MKYSREVNHTITLSTSESLVISDALWTALNNKSLMNNYPGEKEVVLMETIINELGGE